MKASSPDGKRAIGLCAAGPHAGGPALREGCALYPILLMRKMDAHVRLCQTAKGLSGFFHKGFALATGLHASARRTVKIAIIKAGLPRIPSPSKKLPQFQPHP